jgi:hypothetical protein
MSRGFGHVQRAILGLIEANAHDAWTIERLCEAIDPTTPWRPTKARRVAVGRALRRMTLPGTRTVTSPWGDRKFWLCDPCNLVSKRDRR